VSNEYKKKMLPVKVSLHGPTYQHTLSKETFYINNIPNNHIHNIKLVFFHTYYLATWHQSNIL